MAPCVVVERLEGRQWSSRAPVGGHAEHQVREWPNWLFTRNEVSMKNNHWWWCKSPSQNHKAQLADNTRASALVRSRSTQFMVRPRCEPLSRSARPNASCKIFKGRPRRNAFSKLVHRQYKSFLVDRFCQIEMKNPTILSNWTSNAWSCAEDQILENKNVRNMILNICTER